MSYAKELIRKYIEKGQIVIPEEEEKFGVKEFFAAIFIIVGFIVFILLYFGNPEAISLARQILR